MMESYTSGDWHDIYRTVRTDSLSTQTDYPVPPYELASAMNEAFDTGELSFDEAIAHTNTLTHTPEDIPSEAALGPLVKQFSLGKTILYEAIVDHNYHQPYHTGNIATPGVLRPYLQIVDRQLVCVPTVEVTVDRDIAQETILLPIKYCETYAHVPHVALGDIAITAYLSQQYYLQDTPLSKLPTHYSAEDFFPRADLI